MVVCFQKQARKELKLAQFIRSAISSTKEVNYFRYSVTVRPRKCSQLRGRYFLKPLDMKLEKSLSTSFGVRHFTTTFNADRLWANCKPKSVSASQETLVHFREFPQTIFHLLTIYEKQFVYLLLYLFTSSQHLTCFFTLSAHIYTGIIKRIKPTICNIREIMLQKETGFFPYRHNAHERHVHW